MERSSTNENFGTIDQKFLSYLNSIFIQCNEQRKLLVLASSPSPVNDDQIISLSQYIFNTEPDGLAKYAHYLLSKIVGISLFISFWKSGTCVHLQEVLSAQIPPHHLLKCLTLCLKNLMEELNQQNESLDENENDDLLILPFLCELLQLQHKLCLKHVPTDAKDFMQHLELLRKVVEVCGLQTSQDDLSFDKLFSVMLLLFSKLSEHIPKITADNTTHWIIFHKWFDLLWSCSKLADIDLAQITILVLKAVRSFVEFVEKNPNTNINLPTTHIYRLMFLLLLKAWVWMLMAPCSLEDVKEHVESIYKHYQANQVSLNVPSFVELFGAQDDVIMEAMDALLQIHTLSSSRPKLILPSKVMEAIEKVADELDPCLAFGEFLKMIGYDPLVLVDFLLSDETNFLAFFLRFLKYVANGHSVDKNTLEVLKILCERIRKMEQKKLFPYSVKPLLKNLDIVIQLEEKNHLHKPPRHDSFSSSIPSDFWQHEGYKVSLALIFQELDIGSLYQCSCTCKLWHASANQQSVWYFLYQKYYGLFSKRDDWKEEFKKAYLESKLYMIGGSPSRSFVYNIRKKARFEPPKITYTNPLHYSEEPRLIYVFGQFLFALSGTNTVKVEAFDLYTSQSLWKMDGFKEGCSSTWELVADDSKLYVCFPGELRAVEMTSGNIVWSRPMNSAQALCVSGSEISLIHEKGAMAIFHKDTGKRIASFPTPPEAEGTPCSMLSIVGSTMYWMISKKQENQYVICVVNRQKKTAFHDNLTELFKEKNLLLISAGAFTVHEYFVYFSVVYESLETGERRNGVAGITRQEDTLYGLRWLHSAKSDKTVFSAQLTPIYHRGKVWMQCAEKMDQAIVALDSNTGEQIHFITVMNIWKPCCLYIVDDILYYCVCVNKPDQTTFFVGALDTADGHRVWYDYFKTDICSPYQQPVIALHRNIKSALRTPAGSNRLLFLWHDSSY